MGKQKKGNANAQRNNNAKKYGKENDSENKFASYAEMEARKMDNNQK
ncbi:hypothetical protein [Halalkalibacter sp. APA_J-10(15)]|nr:hypothetical protein [Halalkalibacter sp. APA_J-10(15)]MCK0471895.1 hypothetical protein [Halalkalibacter sp. APA_J-10(15)]